MTNVKGEMKEVTEIYRQEGIRLSTPIPNRVYQVESERVVVREEMVEPGRMENKEDTAGK